MTLHPQAQAFVESLAENKPRGWEDMSLKEARDAFNGFAPFLGESRSVKRVENLELDGVPARLYCDLDESQNAPILMYFHGGGWVLGNLDTHDALCRSIALDSSCAVISVEYGLSPENPFPGPLDQCYRATVAAVDRASDLDIDGTRLAVAGDSAGGNLAAAVAIKARDKGGPTIDLQVLIYPVVEPDFNTASYQAYSEGFGLTRSNMQFFWQQYLGDSPPCGRSAPSLATSLEGLPEAIIMTAQYDVLHDEGKRYAEMLSEAGVKVHYEQIPGMLHGFIHFAGLFDLGSYVTFKTCQMIRNKLS